MIADEREEDGYPVAKLVQYFEEAEEASVEAREKSERDRDYYDGKQLTPDEYDTLRKRGQPPIALNVIRSRVDYLKGLEKQQRRDPKAYPRNPQDEEAADAFTDGLRYAAEEIDYPAHRSAAFFDFLTYGYGGVELFADPEDPTDFGMTQVPWDRCFYDPHSCRPDFSDAAYLGVVTWMDYDDAVRKYPDKVNALESTLNTSADVGQTYDDKPRWSIWSDPTRRRVRIVTIWHKVGNVWMWCEFTKGGKLASGESPYITKDGESLCPLILDSAYVDRDNNRYGVVRDLVDPQDEINKRRSKALHLLTVQGVIASKGAVDDVGKVRRELARPDFYVETTPGADQRFEIIRHDGLASGQASLGEQALGYIMQQGPNAALLGKGTEDQSGKAIEAQQAGGLIELGDLMDALRRFDKRVYTFLASMMQQFWTEEKWIRVTDDELAPRYVGLNVPMMQEVQDPYSGQTWQQPAFDSTGQPMIQNPTADLDIDIIISDAPDTINRAGEGFEQLMQAVGMITQGVPPQLVRVAIEAIPGLPPKQKKAVMDAIEQMIQPQQGQGQQAPDPMQAQMAQMAQEAAMADIEKTKADAFRAVAQGEAAMARAQQPSMLPGSMVMQ